jgi:hypothetical protein
MEFENLTKIIRKLFLFFIVSFFPLMMINHLLVYHYSIEPVLKGCGDDWNAYARYSMDIYKNGFSIPSLKENYIAPAGFLYNYFVAIIFYFFGPNLDFIYFSHSLLLSLTVYFSFRTFADGFGTIKKMIFLSTLMLFAFYDVFEKYTFVLLSENLAIFLITMFFYFFKKGIDKSSLIFTCLAAFCLGISVLTRPNIFPFTILLLVFMMFFRIKNKISSKNLIIFSILFLFTLTPLCIRNYLVTGYIKFLPTKGDFFDYLNREYANHSSSGVLSFLWIYLKKILYIFGFLSVLKPTYNFRLQWFIIWVMYIVYFYNYIKFKIINDFNIWEVAMNLYVFSFFGILILLTQIQVYGFRFLLPGLFILIGLAFRIGNPITSKQK